MKSDMTLRKDYTGIDIVKFLSALAVIAIHCRHEGFNFFPVSLHCRLLPAQYRRTEVSWKIS